MKTMKLWRIAFMMLAAFSLASCSSDDDNDVYEAAELGGTWQKVYDEGVADAGTVQYTFRPQSAMARCSTHSVRSLPITAPLIYSPPTGQQATPPFIVSTPSPMLGIC